MPKSKFHNQSDEYIADEYGNLDCQIKTLEKQRDELKDEIKARCRDDGQLIGNRWTTSVSTSTSSRLDTKALRELLGDGLNPYEKESTSTRLTVKPTMILGVAAE